MSTIAMVPADNEGNKLLLKDFRKEGNKAFVKYRSTFNDIPFVEVEIYLVDNKQNYVIVGEDGTVLWRFSTGWLKQIE